MGFSTNTDVVFPPLMVVTRVDAHRLEEKSVQRDPVCRVSKQCRVVEFVYFLYSVNV